MSHDAFTTAYFEAMAFTDCHGDEPELRDAKGWSPELTASTVTDCETFQESNLAELDIAYATGDYGPVQAGHDFWLTRNGHGAGFWDRGLGPVGTRLTDAAHACGSVDLYAGDDGWIYGT